MNLENHAPGADSPGTENTLHRSDDKNYKRNVAKVKSWTKEIERNLSLFTPKLDRVQA